jgi:coenzyme Q-binding protein COQ10
MWSHHLQSITLKRSVLIRDFFQQASPALKRHHERRLIRYPAKLLYEVVSNVDKYHEFVPWCRQSKVLTRSNDRLSAELTVGFKYLTERYVSQVQLRAPQQVIATSFQTNLFESLRTEWKFSPAHDPDNTWVNFQVDFQFRSALYNELYN